MGRNDNANPVQYLNATGSGHGGGGGNGRISMVDPLYPGNGAQNGASNNAGNAPVDNSAGNGATDRYRNNEIVPRASQAQEAANSAVPKTPEAEIKLWEADNPDWGNLHPKMKESTPAFIGDINKQFGTAKTPWITSGYRSPQHNANTPGASPTSWHTKGLAADINLEDYTPEERAIIVNMAQERFGEVLLHDAGTGLHLHIGNPITPEEK